jgi:hypothetical protein
MNARAIIFGQVTVASNHLTSDRPPDVVPSAGRDLAFREDELNRQVPFGERDLLSIRVIRGKLPRPELPRNTRAPNSRPFQTAISPYRNDLRRPSIFEFGALTFLAATLVYR